MRRGAPEEAGLFRHEVRKRRYFIVLSALPSYIHHDGNARGEEALTSPKILTASWFTPLPATHIKIGISRGVPRGLPAGHRLFKKLAPGPWFNSVGIAE